jgi:hypothetical protein
MMNLIGTLNEVISVIGTEFENYFQNIVESQMPAFEIVTTELEKRFELDSSGPLLFSHRILSVWKSYLFT